MNSLIKCHLLGHKNFDWLYSKCVYCYEFSGSLSYIEKSGNLLMEISIGLELTKFFFKTCAVLNILYFC